MVDEPTPWTLALLRAQPAGLGVRPGLPGGGGGRPSPGRLQPSLSAQLWFSREGEDSEDDGNSLQIHSITRPR